MSNIEITKQAATKFEVNSEIHLRALEAGHNSYTNVDGEEIIMNTESLDTSWL